MGHCRCRRSFSPFVVCAAFLLCLFFPAPSRSGNLQMIEKRIAELKAENEQALRQSGELPADGRVALRARAKPDREGGYRYTVVEKTVTPEGSAAPAPAQTQAVAAAVVAAVVGAPPPAGHRPRPYTVQLVSGKDQERSLQVAAGLREIGEDAFTVPVVIPGKGQWTRICIGSYSDMGQAREAVLRLRQRKFPEAFAVKTAFALLAGSGALEDIVAPEAALRAAGHLGYTLQAGGVPDRYRLLVGAYGSRQEAAAAATRLGATGLGELAVVFR